LSGNEPSFPFPQRVSPPAGSIVAARRCRKPQSATTEDVKRVQMLS
jgi:hypothetical protein